ncbi:Protein Aster-C [Tritrichomonas musculus]|uniref:Protein Aster-C n=1 Tax=Tritrichomonas musculus TaxID=1915356 RepID=A0ABR2H7Y9_9EUKA
MFSAISKSSIKIRIVKLLGIDTIQDSREYIEIKLKFDNVSKIFPINKLDHINFTRYMSNISLIANFNLVLSARKNKNDDFQQIAHINSIDLTEIDFKDKIHSREVAFTIDNDPSNKSVICQIIINHHPNKQDYEPIHEFIMSDFYFDSTDSKKSPKKISENDKFTLYSVHSQKKKSRYILKKYKLDEIKSKVSSDDQYLTVNDMYNIESTQNFSTLLPIVGYVRMKRQELIKDENEETNSSPGIDPYWIINDPQYYELTGDEFHPVADESTTPWSVEIDNDSGSTKDPNIEKVDDDKGKELLGDEIEDILVDSESSSNSNPENTKYIESDDIISCIVYDYMHFVTLEELIHQDTNIKKYNNDYKTIIMFEVSHAISCLHFYGASHRHLNSSNILIDTKTLEAKLYDYELSTEITGKDLKGIYYEQEQQYKPKTEKSNDFSDDVFALGLIFFEIATGKKKSRDNNDDIIYLSSNLRLVITQMINEENLQRPRAEEIVYLIISGNFGIYDSSKNHVKKSIIKTDESQKNEPIHSSFGIEFQKDKESKDGSTFLSSVVCSLLYLYKEESLREETVKIMEKVINEEGEKNPFVMSLFGHSLYTGYEGISVETARGSSLLSRAYKSDKNKPDYHFCMINHDDTVDTFSIWWRYQQIRTGMRDSSIFFSDVEKPVIDSKYKKFIEKVIEMHREDADDNPHVAVSLALLLQCDSSEDTERLIQKGVDSYITRSLSPSLTAPTEKYLDQKKVGAIHNSKEVFAELASYYYYSNNKDLNECEKYAKSGAVNKEPQCEYIRGELLLANGEKEKAESYFKRAKDHGYKDNINRNVNNYNNVDADDDEAFSDDENAKPKPLFGMNAQPSRFDFNSDDDSEFKESLKKSKTNIKVNDFVSGSDDNDNEVGDVKLNIKHAESATLYVKKNKEQSDFSFEEEEEENYDEEALSSQDIIERSPNIDNEEPGRPEEGNYGTDNYEETKFENEETKDENEETKDENEETKDENEEAKDENEETKDENEETKDENEETKDENEEAKDENEEAKDENEEAKDENEETKDENEETKDENEETKDENEEAKDENEEAKDENEEAKDENEETKGENEETKGENEDNKTDDEDDDNDDNDENKSDDDNDENESPSLRCIFDVTVVEAKDLPSPGLIKGEHYCTIELGRSEQTKFAKTLSPSWNEQFHFTVENRNEAKLILTVKNHVALRSDKDVSKVEINTSSFTTELTDKWYDLQPSKGNKTGGKIHLSVKCTSLVEPKRATTRKQEQKESVNDKGENEIDKEKKEEEVKLEQPNANSIGTRAPEEHQSENAEQEGEPVGLNPPWMVDLDGNETITQEPQEDENPEWTVDSTQEEQPAITESIEAGEEQELEESKQPESENNEYEYNDDQESAETKQNMKEENEANEDENSSLAERAITTNDNYSENEGNKEEGGEEEEERESVGMNPPSMVDSEVNDTITQELQENDNPIWAADSTQEEQPKAGEEQESEEFKQPESENAEKETTNFLGMAPPEEFSEEDQSENEDEHEGRKEEEEERESVGMNPPSMVDSEVNYTITQESQENDNPIWAADSTQEEQPEAGEEQESEESKQQEPTTNFLRNRPAGASDEEHKTENNESESENKDDQESATTKEDKEEENEEYTRIVMSEKEAEPSAPDEDETIKQEGSENTEKHTISIGTRPPEAFDEEHKNENEGGHEGQEEEERESAELNPPWMVDIDGNDTITQELQENDNPIWAADSTQEEQPEAGEEQESEESKQQEPTTNFLRNRPADASDEEHQSEKEDEHEGRKEEEEERESVGMSPPSMVDSEVNDTITQESQENDNPIWAADSTPEEQPATTESIEVGEEQESEESKQPESENAEKETTNFLGMAPPEAFNEEHQSENEGEHEGQEEERESAGLNPPWMVDIEGNDTITQESQENDNPIWAADSTQEEQPETTEQGLEESKQTTNFLGTRPADSSEAEHKEDSTEERSLAASDLIEDSEENRPAMTLNDEPFNETIERLIAARNSTELIQYLQSNNDPSMSNRVFNRVFATDAEFYTQLLEEGVKEESPIALHKLAVSLIFDKRNNEDYSYAQENYSKARHLLEKCIKQGFTLSYFTLGRLLHEVYQEDSHAFLLAREGAAKGDKYCSCLLGHFISHGVGIQKDFERGVILMLSSKAEDYYDRFATDIALYYYKHARDEHSAFKWFTKAYENSKTSASINNLGLCYLSGIGTAKNIEKAKEIFNVGIEKDDIYSIYHLAFILELKDDHKKALELYKDAADKGNVNAQAYYAYLLHRDDKNSENSRLYFKIAADKGHVASQASLGFLTEETDPQSSLDYYKKAAEKGSPDACAYLAKKYSIENDKENTFKYMKMCSRLGNDIVPLEYAVRLYNRGYFKTAIDYFKMIAEKNNPIAKYFIAAMTFKGEGCVKDENKAFDMMKELADQNIHKAAEFIENYFNQE